MREPTEVPRIRNVRAGDLASLLRLEACSFLGDRLSRRSFQRWINGSSRIFRVIEAECGLIAYALVQLRCDCRHARLYSIALGSEHRGQGLGRRLMEDIEQQVFRAGRGSMRLEVARNNVSALRLYDALGYQVFGEREDYYEDHSDALLMQKVVCWRD